MPAQRSHEPPTLYDWDVIPSGTRGTEGGVTDDRTAAIGHVHRVLKEAAPGAFGKVRKVRTSLDGSVTYIELGAVGEARRDEVTGAVVWTGA